MTGAVTVVGAGAIGGFVGARLGAAGHDVMLLDTAAEHVEAVRRDGLHVRGAAELHVRLPVRYPDERDGLRDRPAVRQGAAHGRRAGRDRAPSRT